MFTTRPDTLFGATYMVLAPEHPLVDQIVPDRRGREDIAGRRGGACSAPTQSPPEAVAAYREFAAREVASSSARPRASEKTGVFTGAFAATRSTAEPIPVFVADYVLMGYGTGAIMAVPAQDERDLEFAERVRPADRPHGAAARRLASTRRSAVHAATGPAINSSRHDEVSLDGLARRRREAARSSSGCEATGRRRRRPSPTSCATGCSAASATGASRSRSSTTSDGLPIALPESMLPVELPELDDFEPRVVADDADTAARAAAGARRATGSTSTLDLGDGPRRYRRETNTMPQWAGRAGTTCATSTRRTTTRSSTPTVERYWMAGDGRPRSGGVDLYVGGVEHAVLHLLYARFWHKVLFDLGHVSTPEPFQRLFNQGYIQAAAFTDDARRLRRGRPRSSSATASYFYDGEPVTPRVREDGQEPEERRSRPTTSTATTAPTRCGSTRCSWARSTPAGRGAPRDIVGVHRFLQRLWRNVVDEETGALRVSPTSRPTTRPAGCCTARSPRSAPTWRTLRVQHRDRHADRAEQPADPGRRRTRRRAARGGRAAGADARAARRRTSPRSCGRAWATTVARVRAVPGGRPRASSSTTRSRSPCRSTARCGPGSRSPPTPTSRRTRPRRGPTPASPRCSPARTVRKVVVVPGRLVNFVLG